MKKKLFLPLIIIFFITGCSKDEESGPEKLNIPSDLVGQWDVIQRYSHFYESIEEITPGYKVWTFDEEGNHTYMDHVGGGTKFGVGGGSSFSFLEGKLRIGSENSYYEDYSVELLTEHELHLKGEHDHLEYKLLKAPVKLYGKWEMKESFNYSNGEIIDHIAFNPGDIIWEFNTTAEGYVKNNIEGVSMGFSYQLKGDNLTLSLTKEIFKVQITPSELVVISNDSRAVFKKLENSSSSN